MKYNVAILIFIFLIIPVNIFGSTKIEKWKAKDGREFNSQKECEEYEYIGEVYRVIVKESGTEKEDTYATMYSFSRKTIVEDILKKLFLKGKTLKVIHIADVYVE